MTLYLPGDIFLERADVFAGDYDLLAVKEPAAEPAVKRRFYGFDFHDVEEHRFRYPEEIARLKDLFELIEFARRLVAVFG